MAGVHEAVSINVRITAVRKLVVEAADNGVLRKKKSRSLRGLLLQAVFVMQASEHGRLFNAMTGWQLVPMVADRNPVLGGFRQART